CTQCRPRRPHSRAARNVEGYCHRARAYPRGALSRPCGPRTHARDQTWPGNHYAATRRMIRIIGGVCPPGYQGIRGVTEERLPMSKFPWKTTIAVSAILAATLYAYAQMSPGGPMGMHGQMH